MKRKILTTIVFMVGLSVGILAQQSGVDEIKRVGNELMAKLSLMLSSKVKKIESCVMDYALQDEVVDRLEMESLRKDLEEFDRLKAKVNKRLSFYQLSISNIDVPEEIRNIVKVYFESPGRHKDNQDGEIKRFFVQKTGMDIKIDKKDKHLFLDYIIIVVVFLIILAVGVVSWLGLLKLIKRAFE